jgi:hypothetical protein
MLTPSSAEPRVAAPHSARLEDAVTLLRRRLEQHLDQESQLQHSYHRWQSRWSDQCVEMTRHLVMLEAHLSTWMQHLPQSPRLSVVDADS